MHQILESKGEHQCVHGHNTLEHRHVAWEHRCVMYNFVLYASYIRGDSHVGINLRSKGQHDYVANHVCASNFEFHQLGYKSLKTYSISLFLF